jgi:AAA domain
MPFEFRPARRENVGLLIGLAGGTGSGKTFTAMRLAKGIAGDRPFVVIDTEAARAKHYADQFRFDHGDLTPPFRPDRYLEAIVAADAAGYPAIVVDSVSHEHAGEGGLLDWHEEELERLTKGDFGKRDAMLMASWIAPKMSHKRFVQRLLQVRAHLILCFRAEPKIEMAKENGRTVVREKKSLVGYNGWIPVTEKSLPYELTVFFMLLAEQPGIPHPIKLQEQHRALFPLEQPITEESGRALAAWAAGGAVNWTARIEAARTKRELIEVGKQLKAAKLPESATNILRAEYETRLKALSQERAS